MRCTSGRHFTYDGDVRTSPKVKGGSAMTVIGKRVIVEIYGMCLSFGEILDYCK